jgi:hypothetical protein
MKRFRKRSVALALSGVALIAVLGIIYGASAEGSSSTTTPISITVSNVGASDPDAIKDLIVRSYSVRTAALKSGDVSQLPSVFADDPSVPLSADRADLVGKVRIRYGKAAQPINGNGWLSFESAKVLDRQQNLDALNRVQATANAQGRALTAGELHSVTQVDGNLPAPAIVDHPQQVILNDVAITGNRAEVTFDDGAITYRATLISTPSGWRIAGEQIVKYHL